MAKLPYLTGILPHAEFTTVACSGGIDSLFAADFLGRSRNIGILYVDHKTEYSAKAMATVAVYANSRSIPFFVESIKETVPKGVSQEEHWRNERYEIFSRFSYPVVTAHHLDDAVETWVWSSCHGQPKLPMLVRGNVHRPFLACRKADMKSWLERNNILWIEDPSNNDIGYTRNYVRHELMPKILHVNPGIHSMVQKRVIKKAREHQLGFTETVDVYDSFVHNNALSNADA